ncbi:hypothetical protein BD311DRAFT_341892 [Dichomitus squalens]|uniref:F-box domain-containing protein n=1 Tax=Dichomitus squalens TaxID=114155 RepID=A0A4Q9N5G4_9APHY|nr:hypothetical protein BD311DRAFT_341892 [Dichomitus squalens]
MSVPRGTTSALPNPHRALSCYDILCMIFDHFEREDPWYDHDTSIGDANSWFARQADALRKRTLGRCARVCKAFSDPALAILWRNIDNLSPFLSVAQSSLRSIPGSALQVVHLAEAGTRVSHYARHIRAVYGLGTTLQASAQNLSLLQTGTASAPLLPQLQRLRWVQVVPSGDELLQFLSPSVHSLHIIFRKAPTWSECVSLRGQPSEYEVYVRTLLKEVASRVPQLRYIRLSTTGDIHESWLEPLCSLRYLDTADLLERIYCDVTTSPLLRPLGSLQGLRHLKLRLPAGLPQDMEREAFPALESLVLDAMFAPLRTVSAFLSGVTSRHLSSLLIHGCGCDTTTVSSTLYEVCDVVRARFAPSLRTLELAFRGVGPVVTHNQPLIQTIEPLLDLHDLNDVSISIAPEIAIVPATEHDLGRMAEAWPKATRLHLSYLPSAASPSLKDIAGFAQRCVGLTDLVLPGIDASASACDVKSETELSSLAAEYQQGKAAPHKLRSLCLSDSGWNSQIPDPMLLAKFLDALFPEVEWKCPPLASDHWRETIQEVLNLRIMRMVRERGSFIRA